MLSQTQPKLKIVDKIVTSLTFELNQLTQFKKTTGKKRFSTNFSGLDISVRAFLASSRALVSYSKLELENREQILDDIPPTL